MNEAETLAGRIDPAPEVAGPDVASPASANIVLTSWKRV
jgi:hypothetical protein